MIERRKLENTIRDPYYWVERILIDHKDYFLTKEEIYKEIPKDENDLPCITINGLETTIRSMLHCRIIVCEYVKGTRYFAINEKKD
jgi:hypothetical protein